MKIDRYIFRQLTVSFFFGILSFCLIFILIDLVENLDDFMDAKVPLATILQFYLSYLPEILYLMIPVSMLLASLFVTGRLASQHELSAIKGSGISLMRMLAPYLVLAFMATGFSFYLSGWLVPEAIQTKFAIDRQYLRRNIQRVENSNILFQDTRNRIIHLGYYDIENRTARNVSIQEFADTNLTMLLQRWDAVSMDWVVEGEGEDSGSWHLVKATHRSFLPTGDRHSEHDRLPVNDSIGRLSIYPADIEKKQRKPQELKYGDLQEFIRNQKNAGQQVSRWLVDYHAKLAFPFATVVVVLFGVPFAANHRKRGTAIEFGISVAVTFIYLAFSEISKVFGYNGDLPPLLTAWMANIVFLAAGIFNLFRVQQ